MSIPTITQPTYANDMPIYDTNPQSFMHNHKLNIASLNCRSLSKPSNPQTSSDFIRYLHSLHLDILCVQGQLNIQFQTSNSLWT